MEMSLSELFTKVRDIPYRIPLSSTEEDFCCTGKHKMLKKLIEDRGLKARWRVCTFIWSDIPLPAEVSEVPHDNNSTHAYLEVNIHGEWKTADATWDAMLGTILPISEWDGVSNTKVAVPVRSLISPQESAEIIANESPEVIEADLAVNGAFYAAFNTWLEKKR